MRRAATYGTIGGSAEGRIVGMRTFYYSAAQRCLHCDYRVAVPTKADAEVLVGYSGGRLNPMRCPAGNGWHLSYPAVELGTRE